MAIRQWQRLLLRRLRQKRQHTLLHHPRIPAPRRRSIQHQLSAKRTLEAGLRLTRCFPLVLNIGALQTLLQRQQA
jgi:hypothetical protein